MEHGIQKKLREWFLATLIREVPYILSRKSITTTRDQINGFLTYQKSSENLWICSYMVLKVDVYKVNFDTGHQ